MLSGIYQIINLVTGDCYIGQSQNLTKRINKHKSLLTRGLHKNLRIQRAWNKYSKKVFEFRIVQLCCINELNSLEQYWMNYFNAEYNLSPSSDTNRGFKHSEESKLKISLTMKGKKFSVDHRKNLGLAFRGKKKTYSKERNLKVANALKGNSNALGRRHTEEAKRKMSESKKKLSKERSEDINDTVK